jgi:hypothetical protein
MRWLSDRTVEHLKRVAEWPDLGESSSRMLAWMAWRQTASLAMPQVVSFRKICKKGSAVIQLTP